MLCIKVQLQLKHLCCAGLFAPSFLRPWVMRVLCHAYSEALGIECAVNRYNNTPKDFIVNFFLSIDSCRVLPFGFDASSISLDG